MKSPIYPYLIEPHDEDRQPNVMQYVEKGNTLQMRVFQNEQNV